MTCPFDWTPRIWDFGRLSGRFLFASELCGVRRLGLSAPSEARLHPPGKPWRMALSKASTESCAMMLNSEVFLSIVDAREKLEHWRYDYNISGGQQTHPCRR